MLTFLFYFVLSLLGFLIFYRYFGFTAVEVVIYPVGDLQEVSKFGFTAAEVGIYPEN